MKTDLLWTGKEYYSLEHCSVSVKETGSTVNSVIIGMYNNQVYKAEYIIKTNNKWETVFFEVKSYFTGREKYFSLKGNGKGSWTKHGKVVKKYNGCIDIDIPLTPFTNTLPINRLALKKNKPQQIKVLYIDIFKQQITAVNQVYTRLSKTGYKYENVPNDFEAVLKVDEAGFVLNYPQLFIRTGIHKSNHK